MVFEKILIKGMNSVIFSFRLLVVAGNARTAVT